MNKLFWLLSFFFLTLALSAQSPEAIAGVWMGEEKDGKFELFEQNGKYFGKITWLKEPNFEGAPKVDRNNPDPNKRNQPIIGLVFMRNFEFNGKNGWTGGKIYDSRTGNTYNCELTLLDPQTIKLRGFVGYSWMGMGKSVKWTRVQ
jgi:uncharacterized protein (DUF2147 family)